MITLPGSPWKEIFRRDSLEGRKPSAHSWLNFTRRDKSGYWTLPIHLKAGCKARLSPKFPARITHTSQDFGAPQTPGPLGHLLLRRDRRQFHSGKSGEGLFSMTVLRCRRGWGWQCPTLPSLLPPCPTHPTGADWPRGFFPGPRLQEPPLRHLLTLLIMGLAGSSLVHHKDFLIAFLGRDRSFPSPFVSSVKDVLSG